MLALSQEVKEIKAQIETTRPEGGRGKLDFSKIPVLPLADRNNLSDLENWLGLEANFTLLVIISLSVNMYSSVLIRVIFKTRY